MIKAGIIGAAGYTAGELLRILIAHPEVQIVFAQSESHANEPVWSAHEDLIGDIDLLFAEKAEVDKADVVFLCGGHGKSKDIIASFPKNWNGRIIDLSNDFRLHADAGDFVYGLPEAFRSLIASARHVANPGCFATSIQLALLPLAEADKLNEIHVTGITGSTGAGVKLTPTSHFSYRDNNVSVYKAFTHQHLGEICETLRTLAPSWNGSINFIPVRGDFPRGIMASVYMDCDLEEADIQKMYKEYYSAEPFVVVTDTNPDLKMVTNTNKCVLFVKKYGTKVHIISMIDNLLKGASGQAVQNMNIIFSLPETLGLRLKGNRF